MTNIHETPEELLEQIAARDAVIKEALELASEGVTDYGTQPWFAIRSTLAQNPAIALDALKLEAKVKLLPSESGFYLSATGKLWTLEVTGYWRDDYDYTRTKKEAAENAPFTRLETQAVTAKAVCDAFYNYPANIPPNARGAVELVWDLVLREFGVAS